MQQRKYVILALLSALSASCSVIALIIAGKPHQIAPGISVPTSMWVFPLVFVFGNIVTEIYGARVARNLVYFVFACTITAMAYNVLTAFVPYPDYWQGQEAYRTVLIQTPRIMVASVTAYFTAGQVSVWTMTLMKKLTGGRWLWSRIVVTAVISQCMDSLLFVGIAFWGIIPIAAVVEMIVSSAVLKTIMQLVGIPLSYAIVRYTKERIENVLL